MSAPHPREVVLLVNPTARKGAGKEALDHVIERLAEHGLDANVETGTDAADAEVIAHHHAARYDTGELHSLVAVGGDGMVCIVAQAVAGTKIPLGVVPFGTGNDFVKALDLPTDPVAAADVIAAGRTRQVDAVRTGDRWWLTIAAAGFDSRANERVNRMSWPKGHLRYDLAAAIELARLKPVRFRMVADGVEATFHATLVAVGNTHTYGGGFKVCPHARPDDGLLGVTVLGPVGRLELARELPAIKANPQREHPMLARFSAREVTLEVLGEDGGPAPELVTYADGDPLAPLPVTHRVVPGAVTLRVP